MNFKLCLTLIDGKILSILTGTSSSQACPICGATPAKFLTVKDFKSDVFKPKQDSLQYGVSPLHCWIRFFESILHISYRVHLQVWQVRGIENKNQFAERKKAIQIRFWKELSLHVDKPKTNGFGSSNDGNTSRKAFSNTKIFSEITGVSFDLIFHFWIILIALNCQLPLNLSKFENYCFETAKIFMEEYPGFPMPASVHKILIHNRKIIQNCLLPPGPGFLGEEAAESRNKFYKQDRENHARRNSRTNTLTDVFNRAMDTSDPLISSLSVGSRKSKLKLKTLPSEVRNLLESYNQDHHPHTEDNDDAEGCGNLDTFLEDLGLDNIELDTEMLSI